VFDDSCRCRATSSITSKGQVHHPQALRQQFGLARAAACVFALVGDSHRSCAPGSRSSPLPESGEFGLL